MAGADQLPVLPEPSRRIYTHRSKVYRCGHCGAPKRNHLCAGTPAGPPEPAPAEPAPATAPGTTLAAGKPGSSGVVRTTWTPEEDAAILAGVQELGFKWRQIAARLPGRSDDSVRNRWNRLEEGRKSGSQLLGDVPGYRCAKCGLRKKGHTCIALSKANANVANPDTTGLASSSGMDDWRDAASLSKRAVWSPAEDMLIISKVEQFGQRWNIVAAELPGRTDHAVRNRWHRLQRKIKDQPQSEPLQSDLCVDAEAFSQASVVHHVQVSVPPQQARPVEPIVWTPEPIPDS